MFFEVRFLIHNQMQHRWKISQVILMNKESGQTKMYYFHAGYSLHLLTSMNRCVYKSVVPLVMETNGIAVMKNWNKEADIWNLTLICKNSAGRHQQVSIVEVTGLQDALHFESFT